MTDSGSRLERIIGLILGTGVTASTFCLAAGLLLSVTGAAPAGLLLQAGVIILIATPVARVVASIVEYASDRDWAFALLTTIVLLELMTALALNRRV